MCIYAHTYVYIIKEKDAMNLNEVGEYMRGFGIKNGKEK